MILHKETETIQISPFLFTPNYFFIRMNNTPQGDGNSRIR